MLVAPINPKVRELKEEHPNIVFRHGGGRYWCYDVCHNQKKMTTLVSMRGEPIEFNESYILCGQCHFQRQMDWYFGAHGKRVGAWDNPNEIPVYRQDLKVEDRESIGTWDSERVLFNCTACHNAHSPSIKPFKPSPPPNPRAGLEHTDSSPKVHLKVWEHFSSDSKEH